MRVASVSATTIPHVADRTLLTEVELFEQLSHEEVDGLAEACEERELQRGDVLFAEGDEADRLFVVEKGRIAISNKSIDGRESMISLMERGDLFGEMPLFDGLTRSAEARALEQSSVLAIPYEPLRAMYETRPDRLWKVVALLASRLRTVDAALADSVFLDVTGRTAKRLLELAGDAEEFALPITQEELAGMVGASRERVNKAIASFIRLGWIEQADRRYRITNRVQLERRAR
jgi:CRP-like cAMP-binding protein